MIDERGWFAEVRIPFSSLRFQENDEKVIMGLILYRYIPRKNESDIYPAIPPNWGQFSSWKCSRACEISLEGIQSRNPLYITPYGLGGYGQIHDLNEAETAYVRTDNPVREMGLDIKYGLTSNLTMDLTLNTDFAQVEADDVQVNLTRYSLYYPEKRLFFQERASVFDFSFGGPTNVFYSRQIGLYEEEIVPIYGGARLSENDYLLFNWAQCLDDEQPDTSKFFDQARFRLGWERRTDKGLGGQIAIGRRGPDYDPGMGFELLENYLVIHQQTQYGWLPGPESPLQAHNISHNTRLIYRNEDGGLMIMKLEATLSTALTTSAFIQYNSAASIVITNFRLRFNPREGNDLYLVINENFFTNRTAETPFLPPYDSRAVMVKYSHTFAY